MSDVVVHMKSGERREFLHRGRAGGSYTVNLTLENGFAIIEDEWHKRTIIPAADIESIEETPERSW